MFTPSGPLHPDAPLDLHYRLMFGLTWPAPAVRLIDTVEIFEGVYCHHCLGPFDTLLGIWQHYNDHFDHGF